MKTSEFPKLGQEQDFCNQRPLHTIAEIQAHGYLIVIDGKTQRILQVSANLSSVLHVAMDRLISAPLSQVIDPEEIERLNKAVEGADRCLVALGPLRFLIDAKIEFYASVRHMDGLLFLELERTDSYDPRMFLRFDNFLKQLEYKLRACATAADVCAVAIPEIRVLIGFDRIMGYQFNPDMTGTVVAEDGNGELERYMGLRFPASDIPVTARRLYELNAVRIIPNAFYKPVPLVPAVNALTGNPTDLTFCSYRSVMPVHLEYLRNMQVSSSMSISIFINNQLWGLFICHNKQAKNLDPHLRSLLRLVSNIVSAKVLAAEIREQESARSALKSTNAELRQALASSESVSEGLKRMGPQMLSLAAATGAVLYLNDEMVVLGKVPPQNSIIEIIEWVQCHAEGTIFQSHALSTLLPNAAASKEVASGILAVSLSADFQDGLIWFRPEIIQIINWGGNPNDALSIEPDMERYHPRRSFHLWQQQVAFHSMPWQPHHLEAAAELRILIIEVMLRVQNAQLRKSSEELARSNQDLEHFADIASHDLQEPLQTMLSYTQLIKKRYVDNVNERDQVFLDFIADAALRGQQLVSNLLAYSRLRGIDQSSFVDENTESALNGALANLGKVIQEKKVTIQKGPLPAVRCHVGLLTQVFQNLISNALKFTPANRQPQVRVWSDSSEAYYIFHVQDNGIGIEQQHLRKIFDIFEKLHPVSEYQGSGIGLAVCKKIVDMHGGTIWVESGVGQGSVFSFTIPKLGKESDRRK